MKRTASVEQRVLDRRLEVAQAQMNAKPTPGPWRTCKLSAMEGGKGQVVADVPTCFGSIAVRADVLTACPPVAVLDAEGEANAKLIAAAPDLLRACLEVVEHYTTMSGNPNFPVADKYWISGAIRARDAIAKATK